MQSMRDAAPDVLREILASQPTTEAKVLFAWRMAAGPAMARAARAAWTPDGTLRLTPASGAGEGPGQARAEIWRARAKSFVVRPPAEWVLSVSVTLFHAIAMSGWWPALSAR